MTRLAYYFLILPVSLLPFPVLYLLSDVLYIILYYLLGYRKVVVSENIDRVFPDKTEIDKQKLIKGFYSHFCDLIVEGIKAFTISNASIERRYKIIGHELTFLHQEQGKDIIVAAGHCANWEWASLACPLKFRHKCAVIITPLTNQYLNKKVSDSRSRNGYDLVPKHDAKAYLHQKEDLFKATFFLTDQSPSNPDNAFWTPFLGIESPVQFGIEKYAKEDNVPVYYIEVLREKRGYYNVEVSLLIEDPSKCEYGEIIKIVTDRISKTVNKQPSHWLWSHRRWKHKKRGI